MIPRFLLIIIIIIIIIRRGEGSALRVPHHHGRPMPVRVQQHSSACGREKKLLTMEPPQRGLPHRS